MKKFPYLLWVSMIRCCWSGGILVVMPGLHVSRSACVKTLSVWTVTPLMPTASVFGSMWNRLFPGWGDICFLCVCLVASILSATDVAGIMRGFGVGLL